MDIGIITAVLIQCLSSFCPAGKKIPGIIQLLKGIVQVPLEIPYAPEGYDSLLDYMNSTSSKTRNFKDRSEHICHICVNHVSVFVCDVFQRFL